MTDHSAIDHTGLTGVGGANSLGTDTLWDAKGDLVAATGANTAAKLTVAANGALLETASGETTGLKWSKIIRGTILANGSGVASGTGFTVTDNGTGNYTVNYTVSFAATPVVVATAQGASVGRIVSITASSASACTLRVVDDGGSDNDMIVNFIAIAV